MCCISVIALAYNPGPYLLPCLRSIAAQTYKNLEVIVVDNGSTDGSGKIADDFAKTDPRFAVLHQQNLGSMGGRAAGYGAATGAYVVFVDTDDLLHPRMIERLYSACHTSGLPLAGCRFAPFSDTPPAPVPPPDAHTTFCAPGHLHALLHNKSVEYSLCNKLYRRDVLARADFASGIAYNEDLLFNWQVFEATGGLAFCDFVGYFYRQHTESITHRPLQATSITDQLAVASKILQQATGTTLQNSAEGFYYEKLLYLNSMILRQPHAKQFKALQTDLVHRLRSGFAPALKNENLSFSMKVVAVFSCWGGPFYALLCRLVLTDRR